MTSREPEVYGTTTSSSSQILQQGWVRVKREGLPLVGEWGSWGWASSVISAGECQAGQRVEGQPIDLEQAHRFGEMSKETGRSGKTSGKLIWDRAHMSSESLFEMKLCLVASLPTTAISLVLLEGMCKHLCVHATVHVCLTIRDHFNNRPSRWVCECAGPSNFKERGVMTASLLVPWLNLHLAQF